MEHLYKYIKSSKFDEDKFSNSNVTISLKVDGTPFQIVFDDGKVTFHKRAKDNKSEGDRITQMDAFTNPAFYPVMTYVYGGLKDNIDKFGGVKLINAEILIENEHHKIQYNHKPNGNLCLLNGMTTNGNSIKSEIIDEYAKIIGVETIPVVYQGKLGSKAKELIKYVERNCDPHNPHTSENFKNDILEILEVTCDSPLFDTVDGNIEGFVLDFGFDVFKIDSPSFMQMMKDNNRRTSVKDAKEIENVLEDIYNYIEVKDFKFKKYSNNEFRNILQNYDKCCSEDGEFVDFLYSKGKSCLLGDMLYSKDINTLPKKFASHKGDDKFLYSTRLFVWLFSEKKTTKNYPILQKFSNFIK